ncbi:MAG: amidohydrolase family protein [Microbacteriaceae bacterium]|nr:amidohydrolase family protein [Microbacteriaceae bacterium]
MTIRNARIGDGLVDVEVREGVIAAVSPSSPSSSSSSSSSSSVHFAPSSPAGRGRNRTLADEAVGEGAAEVDAEGRWLIPGLWDEHVHFDHWASSRRRIDLSAAASAAEAAAIVAARAEQGADLVVGRAFRDALWPDTPDRALLDRAFPGRPVVLVSADLHCVWLNTPALARFGVAGHPTGLLREDAGFAILRALDDGDPAERDAWALQAGRAAAARGVVGIHDLEMGFSLDGWRRRMAAGFDALRVEGGVYADGLDRAAAEGLRTGLEIGPLLSVGRFKVITDGSLGTRTAYCVDPYPGTHGHGLLAVPPEDLRELLRRAGAIGLEPAVHAIGDEANRLALDVMTELRTGGRIEHAQLLRLEDVPRFAAGGIAASIQPEHAMDDRDIADRYWPGRTGRAYLFRALLDAGVRVVLGSDAPVAPLDPWHAVAAAVERRRDGREPWHPEQAVSAVEALACSVRSAVAAGERADLVLLDADPLGDPGRLREMPVAATFLGGRATHSTLADPLR